MLLNVGRNRAKWPAIPSDLSQPCAHCHERDNGGPDGFFRTASAYLAGELFADNPALTDDGQQREVPFLLVYGWMGLFQSRTDPPPAICLTLPSAD
jgi:hypothetical protein